MVNCTSLVVQQPVGTVTLNSMSLGYKNGTAPCVTPAACNVKTTDVPGKVAVIFNITVAVAPVSGTLSFTVTRPDGAVFPYSTQLVNQAVGTYDGCIPDPEVPLASQTYTPGTWTVAFKGFA